MTELKSASINTIKAFAKLHRQKRDIDAQLTRIKSRIADEEPRVVAYFQRHGIPSVKTEDGTVHLRRELWAGRVNGVEDEVIADSLDEVGLAHVVKCKMNVQSMSAAAREAIEQNSREDDNRDPEEIFFDVFPMLRGFVKISELFKVGVRKS